MYNKEREQNISNQDIVLTPNGKEFGRLCKMTDAPCLEKGEILDLKE